VKSDQHGPEQPAAPGGVVLELTQSDVRVILEGMHALQLSKRTTATETQAVDELQHRLKGSPGQAAGVANRG
jgi:hypothetical protein